MVKVLSTASSPATVVALARGDVFYSAGVVPDNIEHLARVDMIASGEARVIAKKDLIIIVDGLWHIGTGANHIFFMREERMGKEIRSLWFARPHTNEDLKEALLIAGVPHVECIGGFDNVLVYGDEIAVPEDGRTIGFYGWIIKRDEAEKYLKQAMDQRVIPRTGRLKVWHEIRLDHNGEKYPVVRIEGWSEPQPNNDVTVWEMNEYQVLYDRETRIVQRITLTNVFVDGLPCDRSPIRSIALGKRMPDNLVWRH